MALSLRYVKPTLLKVVTRHCRPYSAQIDGLRWDENSLELSPREELTHYQDLVTDKVSAILEEGKRLANSVCAINRQKNGASNVTKDGEDEIDFAKLIREANELQAQLAVNTIVPHFHFFDSPPEKEISKVSLTDRSLVQSYSYGGDNQSCTNVTLGDLWTNCKVLDDTFGVDTKQTLPPHLLAYVRENIADISCGGTKNQQELLQRHLESHQLQIDSHVYYSADKSPDAVQTDKSLKQPGSERDGEDDRAKPSRDQLIKIHELMTKELPRILLNRHDYRQYRPDVLFENNFYVKPYTTKGIAQYVVEVAKLRIWAHFKYANVKMSLLKSTIEEEEGTVTFHWRMSGVPQVRAFMFWKFLPWTYKDTVRKESDYHEGVSTFHVDNTGLIAKHKLDRMMLDKEYEQVKPRRSLRERLNRLLQPKPAIGAACKSGER